MGLKVKGVDCVANPIGTVALEHNDTKAYEETKDFDPVVAKMNLIQNSALNGHKKSMVAISDAIALLEKMAKENDKNSTEIVSKINAKKIREFVHKGSDSSAEDIDSMLNEIFAEALDAAEIDTDKFYDKVAAILDTIDDARDAVREKRRALHEALTAVIAVSDADANATAIREAMHKKGDMSDITKHIREDVMLRDFMKHKHPKRGGWDRNSTNREFNEKMRDHNEMGRDKGERNDSLVVSDKKEHSRERQMESHKRPMLHKETEKVK